METIGRYEIKGELGRGGMAIVYRAIDPNIGREVAIKVLPREFMQEADFLSRFQREVKTVGQLSHAAIVPIYDAAEDKGQPYLVMRLMKGGSLLDRVRRGPLPLNEVVAIFNRLGGALDEAHSKGVIHRDLKPGNILLDELGQPYLSDFGIVKLTEATSMTSRGAIGTPAYMSPEHFHGKVNSRSDVYAMGVILFQLLTGRLPFQAQTPPEYMRAHFMDLPPLLHNINPNLPSELEPILQRALAKSAEERYATVGEMAKALSKVASLLFEDKPTIINTLPPAISQAASQSISTTESQLMMRSSQNIPWGWLGVGIVILLLFIIGLFVSWQKPFVVEQVVTATVGFVPTMTLPHLTPDSKGGTGQAQGIAPTDTPIPLTNTPILPTNTPLSPLESRGTGQAQGIAPTETPIPLTNTPILPTNTPVNLTTALAAPPPQGEPKLLPYIVEGDIYGYMDISGTVVIEPQFDFATDFVNGLAAVSQKGKFGYIDETGAWVIKPQFRDARPFAEGLALVDTAVGKSFKTAYVYIDKTGKIVIPNTELHYNGSFKEGLAMMTFRNLVGFIDKTGEVVIQPQYDGANDFTEGLSAVITEGKTGYIDITGKMVIKPQFDYGALFSEGLAQVSLNQKPGFIDKTGKMVIQPAVDYVGDFHDGLALVSLEGKIGYMDKTGKIVIEPQFVYGDRFADGLAPVQIGNKYGYIDKTGQVVITPTFTAARVFQNGLASVQDEMSQGYIDIKGNMVIEMPLPSYSRPRTQLVPFMPVIPTETQEGSCFTNSNIVNLPTAWRCTTNDNMLLDPCLLAGDGKTLVCGADPTTGAEGFALKLTEPLPTPTPMSKKLTREMLENATYTFVEPFDQSTTEITLKDGQFEGQYGTGATEKNSYILLDATGYGDLNGDGLEDAAVVIAMNGGGTGWFEQLIAVINDNGKPKQVATNLLGDRTKINSIMIYGGYITVDILSHGPNDGACCPTMPLIVQYVLDGNELKEQSTPQWLMQLDDGSTCNFATGASALVGDKRINYYCTEHGDVLGDVMMNTLWDDNSAWTVEKVVITSTGEGVFTIVSSDTVKVNTVWQPVDPLQTMQIVGLTPQSVTMTLGKVAYSMTGQVRPLIMPDSPHAMNGEPAHLHFTFDSGTLPSWGGLDTTQPQLLIYPVTEYHNIYAQVGSMEVDYRLELLQTLLATRPMAISETLPVLPDMYASQVLTAQVKYLDFKNGSGLRFVTHYAQDASPLTNETLFYTFQGITKDNLYYISYFSPITTSVLPNSYDESEAAKDYDAFVAEFDDYLVETQEALDKTTDFTPTLTSLDSMLQSLQVGP